MVLAGVPLCQSIAGLAMGFVQESDQTATQAFLEKACTLSEVPTPEQLLARLAH